MLTSAIPIYDVTHANIRLEDCCGASWWDVVELPPYVPKAEENDFRECMKRRVHKAFRLLKAEILDPLVDGGGGSQCGPVGGESGGYGGGGCGGGGAQKASRLPNQLWDPGVYARLLGVSERSVAEQRIVLANTRTYPRTYTRTHANAREMVPFSFFFLFLSSPLLQISHATVTL